MKRKEVPPKNLLAKTPGEATANMGYKQMGNKEVIVKGKASEIHHMATMRRTARPREANGRCTSKSTLKHTSKIKADTSIKKAFL
mmetsp:Transcript_69555/g.151878  ORF Transcript_69555/g.151878 Transcript_69555/m.151878 type:complete len:85 (-) Transcript_69555:308-562(-)